MLQSNITPTRWKLISKVSTVCFEGEDDEALKAAAEAKAAAEKADADAKRSKAVNLSKTPEELSKELAGARHAYKAELGKAADRERKLSEDVRLSQAERDEAAARAEHLESQFKTEKELAERREKKIIEDKDKEIKKHKDEATTYKGKWANSVIKTELVTETALADEAIPGQLQKVLKPDTILVDELVDGKPTGEQVVRINFEDVDAEGKTITLQLSVKEALKRMKELPERFGNYFKGVGSSGIDGGNGKGGGSGATSLDTATYIAQRNRAKKGS